jgi:hypothetical protein
VSWNIDNTAGSVFLQLQPKLRCVPLGVPCRPIDRSPQVKQTKGITWFRRHFEPKRRCLSLSQVRQIQTIDAKWYPRLGSWYETTMEPTIEKPFHLMTPGERTAARIAKNRAIEERVGGNKMVKPPSKSSGDFTRATPEEHASKRGGVVRKVQS